MRDRERRCPWRRRGNPPRRTESLPHRVTENCNGSDHPKHLRPDRKHGQKQADRRECESLLSDGANHGLSPLRVERNENIVRLLFRVNGGQWVSFNCGGQG